MASFATRLVGALCLLLALGTSSAFASQATAPPPPLHVGGAVKPPVKIKDSKPVYPEDARRAKVQGVVITEATIGVDGKVTAAKVLRSIPMLDDAAITAVKEQLYKPTLVDGKAVAVITTVPIFFTLD
jgi:periplasmic protein TonB